jgi:hypothetical protein
MSSEQKFTKKASKSAKRRVRRIRAKENKQTQPLVKEPEKTICEDCGRLNVLHKVPACADYQIAGRICCDKDVCKDYCVFKCSLGHENQVINYDGDIGEQTCLVCKEKWTPKFEWHGISIREHIRRYGD